MELSGENLKNKKTFPLDNQYFLITKTSLLINKINLLTNQALFDCTSLKY